MFRNQQQHSRNVIMTLALTLGLMTPALPSPASPPPAQGVHIKPIGNPTWKPVDFYLFSAPIGTAASGYAEFLTTLLALLPLPNHAFHPDLTVGLGAPHQPPYDSELANGVASLGFREGVRFNRSEVLGLTIPASTPQAQSNGNPGVIPPNAQPYGLSYGQWSARWWQWAISIPADTNPLLDATGANCAQGQSGPVWFLAGTTGNTATRTCTVPVGKALFFPLLNVIFGSGVFDCDPTNPGVPCDVDTLRTGAASFIDNPMLLEASIDGRALQNLSAYRAQSPVFSITVPQDAVFGLPLSGTFSPQVSDGYWLMLAPLSAGNHTVHFKAATSFGFTLEVTYYLTVAPR